MTTTSELDSDSDFLDLPDVQQLVIINSDPVQEETDTQEPPLLCVIQQECQIRQIDSLQVLINCFFLLLYARGEECSNLCIVFCQHCLVLKVANLC